MKPFDRIIINAKAQSKAEKLHIQKLKKIEQEKSKNVVQNSESDNKSEENIIAEAYFDRPDEEAKKDRDVDHSLNSIIGPEVP